MNGGDLCLLNNVFPGFHISGVCSDIRSFNRILCWIWMLLTRFDRDVIDSAANSTTFTVSPSAVYNGVARDREQPAAPAWADKRSVQYSLNEYYGFIPLLVRLSDVALVNRAWWECKLFIPFFKLRNNLSLTECALRWRHDSQDVSEPKICRKCAAIRNICEFLRKLRSLLDFAINSAIAKSWRDLLS